MKTLIQNFKEKFQKTLDSLDLKRNPELESVAMEMRSKIDLADYLLEKPETLEDPEKLLTELEEMRDQVRNSSGCIDLKTNAEIVSRLDSKIEFLEALIDDIKEKDAPIFGEVCRFLSFTLEMAIDYWDRIGNGLELNQSEMRKLNILNAFCSKLEETLQEWNVEESEHDKLR